MQKHKNKHPKLQKLPKTMVNKRKPENTWKHVKESLLGYRI